jgi:hypothetical protein
MPNHLAQQFHHHSAYNRPPPPQQAQQAPSTTWPYVRQQASQPPPGPSAVQEGEKITLQSTIEPSTVKYDPQTKQLTFFITSTAELCFYEVHTGIRETIRKGEVVYTPNKPKPRPPTVTVEGACENKETTVVLDTGLMDPQELVYNKAFPKQMPCSIILRYCDDFGDHAEHTVVNLVDQLPPGRSSRVIKQTVATNGSCYLVENLFGTESEVTIGAVMGGGESNSPGEGGSPAGAASAPGSAVAVESDDDALCVICITNDKDTAVLPCRHMCLCKGCAQELMRHTPKCPVCRGPISQLLHMSSKK